MRQLRIDYKKLTMCFVPCRNFVFHKTLPLVVSVCIRLRVSLTNILNQLEYSRNATSMFSPIRIWCLDLNLLIGNRTRLFFLHVTKPEETTELRSSFLIPD